MNGVRRMFTPAEAETCLETKEQGYKRRRWNDMYIERELIFSEAVKALTATALRVYLIFLTKRQWRPLQGKAARRAGKGKYELVNQGQIIFTYGEAERYGILRAAFRDAIDLLVEVGLLDIAESGSGLHRQVTRYSISERWRLYARPEFVTKKRPKRHLHYGFAGGNTCAAKRKSQR